MINKYNDRRSSGADDDNRIKTMNFGHYEFQIPRLCSYFEYDWA